MMIPTASSGTYVPAASGITFPPAFLAILGYGNETSQTINVDLDADGDAPGYTAGMSVYVLIVGFDADMTAALSSAGSSTIELVVAGTAGGEHQKVYRIEPTQATFDVDVTSVGAHDAMISLVSVIGGQSDGYEHFYSGVETGNNSNSVDLNVEMAAGECALASTRKYDELSGVTELFSFANNVTGYYQGTTTETVDVDATLSSGTSAGKGSLAIVIGPA